MKIEETGTVSGHVTIETIVADIHAAEKAHADHDAAVISEEHARSVYQAFPADSPGEKARLRGLWETAVDHVKQTREAERTAIAAASDHCASMGHARKR